MSLLTFPLKFAVKFQVLEKVGFGPSILWEGIPQISGIHFQIALTCEHVAPRIWLSSVQRARRVAVEQQQNYRGKSEVRRRLRRAA